MRRGVGASRSGGTLETRQRVRTGPFAGGIELGIGTGLALSGDTATAPWPQTSRFARSQRPTAPSVISTQSETCIGIIATLDPVGHPDRLPVDTVVWPCGAYGCCCGDCVPEQPCPALCTVEPINGIPGAHRLILGGPDWTLDVEDIYRRLRADGWTPADARSAAVRL